MMQVFCINSSFICRFYLMTFFTQQLKIIEVVLSSVIKRNNMVYFSTFSLIITSSCLVILVYVNSTNSTMRMRRKTCRRRLPSKQYFLYILMKQSNRSFLEEWFHHSKCQCPNRLIFEWQVEAFAKSLNVSVMNSLLNFFRCQFNLKFMRLFEIFGKILEFNVFHILRQRSRERGSKELGKTLSACSSPLFSFSKRKWEHQARTKRGIITNLNFIYASLQGKICKGYKKSIMERR